MTTVDHLTAARNLIQEGWIKGHMQSIAGVCAVGAICLTASPGSHAMDYLVRALPHPYQDRGSIPFFNDAVCTTKQDVLDLFDAAIAVARESEDVIASLEQKILVPA